MARVFITGSADGLGLMAARLLIEQGHEVTLHARNDARASDARAALPAASGVVICDLSSIDETRSVAEEANSIGRFGAVIHNAGVGYREPRRIQTPDGLSHVFAINVLAPYLLTALITPASPPSTTCNGRNAAGTGRRPTPTASSSTSCWPSPSPAAGPPCSRTPSSPAGYRRRWAAPARPTTSPWPP